MRNAKCELLFFWSSTTPDCRRRALDPSTLQPSVRVCGMGLPCPAALVAALVFLLFLFPSPSSAQSTVTYPSTTFLDCGLATSLNPPGPINIPGYNALGVGPRHTISFWLRSTLNARQEFMNYGGVTGVYCSSLALVLQTSSPPSFSYYVNDGNGANSCGVVRASQTFPLPASFALNTWYHVSVDVRHLPRARPTFSTHTTSSPLACLLLLTTTMYHGISHPLPRSPVSSIRSQSLRVRVQRSSTWTALRLGDPSRSHLSRRILRRRPSS
jgi:hypothetical protein